MSQKAAEHMLLTGQKQARLCRLRPFPLALCAPAARNIRPLALPPAKLSCATGRATRSKRPKGSWRRPWAAPGPFWVLLGQTATDN